MTADKHYLPEGDINRSNKRPAEGARGLIGSIYVPTVAFFQPKTEDLDLVSTSRHAIALAKAGVSGLVTHGSNGEAVHLSPSEQFCITSATRQALDSAGFKSLPIIVGCGAQSTQQTIDLCKQAFEAGGDYSLVLPPSYYRTIMTRSQVKEYFFDVADASPIGIIIYNYPGASSGLDLDSSQIIELSKHPNIKGVKLTCGNTGKLARVVAGSAEGFVTMGGSADFLLQTLIVGGQGVIAGLANLSPKACLKIVELHRAGELEEAQRLQAIVARGDWVAIQGGFPVVKSALGVFRNYGGSPRKPCIEPSSSDRKTLAFELKELMEVEDSL